MKVCVRHSQTVRCSLQAICPCPLCEQEKKLEGEEIDGDKDNQGGAQGEGDGKGGGDHDQEKGSDQEEEVGEEKKNQKRIGKTSTRVLEVVTVLYTLGQTPEEIGNICTEAVTAAADGSKLKRAPMVSVLLAIVRCLRNICSFCVNKSHMHTLAARALHTRAYLIVLC